MGFADEEMEARRTLTHPRAQGCLLKVETQSLCSDSKTEHFQSVHCTQLLPYQPVGMITMGKGTMEECLVGNRDSRPARAGGTREAHTGTRGLRAGLEKEIHEWSTGPSLMRDTKFHIGLDIPISKMSSYTAVKG